RDRAQSAPSRCGSPPGRSGRTRTSHRRAGLVACGHPRMRYNAVVAERVLTQRELNRALLARQLLLDRKRLSLPKALERIGGIQAQYAPSMYVGLWSRLEGFERPALDRALERR